MSNHFGGKQVKDVRRDVVNISKGSALRFACMSISFLIFIVSAVALLFSQNVALALLSFIVLILSSVFFAFVLPTRSVERYYFDSDKEYSDDYINELKEHELYYKIDQKLEKITETYIKKYVVLVFSSFLLALVIALSWSITMGFGLQVFALVVVVFTKSIVFTIPMLLLAPTIVIYLKLLSFLKANEEIMVNGLFGW